MERVRAIIIEKRSLLVIHRVKQASEYWVFPGGGVEDSDESLEQALHRECREELGVEIQIESLFAELTLHHSRELFYMCTILSGAVGTGAGPEFQPGKDYIGTHSVEWIHLEHLEEYNIKPESIKRKVLKDLYEIL